MRSACMRRSFSLHPPYENDKIDMTLAPEPLFPLRERYLSLLERLTVLFRKMDQAYDDVADRYGFHCQGCADNCCLTRFHHHTLLEFLYLLEGMRTLAPAIREEVVRRAHTVCSASAEADRRGEPLRMMCPLNDAGLCRLYAQRPMICRLHGIPHELHRPGAGPVKNPGCDAFFDQCRATGATDYIPFDRTPFYRQMAMLEKELRLKTGYSHKLKLTVAQMLTTLSNSDHEID